MQLLLLHYNNYFNRIIKKKDTVADYKAGKDRAIKFMVGQVMKKSKGQANPQLVNQLLLEELAKL